MYIDEMNVVPELHCVLLDVLSLVLLHSIKFAVVFSKQIDVQVCRELFCDTFCFSFAHANTHDILQTFVQTLVSAGPCQTELLLCST